MNERSERSDHHSYLHAELERRWSAARKEMKERKIDALVMQNDNDWLGGYVK